MAKEQNSVPMAGNTWAEQWEVNNDSEAPKQKQEQQEKNKQGEKLTKKLGESFNKTKEGASKSAKVVKDGASVGFSWIKDKCTKKTPN